MHISMFTSWQVHCGIASYASHLRDALNTLDDTRVSIVPYDRQVHPRADYVRWGQSLNHGEIAHIQHEYAFFGYLLPWQNHFRSLTRQIDKPIVITKHVSFDGPLNIPGHNPAHLIKQIKWAMYNRWLGPYASYLNKGTFEIAQQIIVLSARLKDQLIRRGLKPDRIHVIPAGVPQFPTVSGGDQLRADWSWHTKKIIGLFGYITPAKGHLIALDSLAHLPEDYVLLIAGGLRRGADRSALDAIEQKIDQLRLQPRVRITGYLEEADIAKHIQACQVLIYPYTHVDSSYSVVTGLAYQSVPIIASDVYAHRELASQGAGLALFRSGEPIELAKSIEAIVNDRDRQAQMLAADKRYAYDHSWSAIAQQTREVYRQAIATMGL